MKTAKIFATGRSQAVRLPKECRFSGTEVYVKKLGDVVILFPKAAAWATFLSSLEHFTADFMSDRAQPSEQPRSET